MLVEGQFGQTTRYPLDLTVQRRMCAAKSRPSADKLYRAQLSLSDPVPTLGTAQVSIVVRVIELWGCRFKPAELPTEAVAGRLRPQAATFFQGQPSS